MERFGYVRAANTAEALAYLNEAGLITRPLAGGTDLLLLTRIEKICDRVVDITPIPELRRIERQGSLIRIGAAVTFSEVVESPIIQECAPLLAQACRQVGAVQVRNMGTLGGNVANAAACADSLPALVCLDAVVEIATPQGTLSWPVSEFVLGPNRTRLPASSLITHLSFPIPPAGSRSTFLKLGRRNAMAISRLTVAALGRTDERGRIAEARLVPGSAAPQIRRFSGVEEFLTGQQPGPDLCREAGRRAVSEMAAITGKRWSSEYKEPALQVMVARALEQVFCAVPEEERGSA